MNTSIVGKQFKLTEPIKDYVLKAFSSFEKYGIDIISSKCTISADEKGGKKGFCVDFSLNISKKGTVVIGTKDKDLYVAIDTLTDKFSKFLRREHDKITTHKNKDIHKQMIKDTGFETSDEVVNEIVVSELIDYKPLEIEEALRILKSSSDQFLVFNDINAKMRVLYKRKDNRFGIY